MSTASRPVFAVASVVALFATTAASAPAPATASDPAAASRPPSSSVDVASPADGLPLAWRSAARHAPKPEPGGVAAPAKAGCVPSPGSGCVVNQPGGDDLPTWFMTAYWRGSAIAGLVAKPPRTAEVRVTTSDRRRVLARANLRRDGEFRVMVPRAHLRKRLVLRLVTPDGTQVTYQHAPTRPGR